MPFAPQSNRMKKRFASIRSLLSPGPAFPALALSDSTTWTRRRRHARPRSKAWPRRRRCNLNYPRSSWLALTLVTLSLATTNTCATSYSNCISFGLTTPKSFNLLAFTYQRLGEWQKAIDAFDQVIVLNPRYLLVRKFAAYTRCDVRDWPGAQRIVDEALQIWPADLNLLAIKAQIFQANGQLDQAQLIVDKLKPDRLDYDAVGAVWYQAKLRRKPATALKLFEPLARRTDSLKEWMRDAQIFGELQELSGDTAAARATFSHRSRCHRSHFAGTA